MTIPDSTHLLCFQGLGKCLLNQAELFSLQSKNPHPISFAESVYKVQLFACFLKSMHLCLWLNKKSAILLTILDFFFYLLILSQFLNISFQVGDLYNDLPKHVFVLLWESVVQQ